MFESALHEINDTVEAAETQCHYGREPVFSPLLQHIMEGERMTISCFCERHGSLLLVVACANLWVTAPRGAFARFTGPTASGSGWHLTFIPRGVAVGLNTSCGVRGEVAA